MAATVLSTILRAARHPLGTPSKSASPLNARMDRIRRRRSTENVVSRWGAKQKAGWKSEREVRPQFRYSPFQSFHLNCLGRVTKIDVSSPHLRSHRSRWCRSAVPKSPGTREPNGVTGASSHGSTRAKSTAARSDIIWACPRTAIKCPESQEARRVGPDGLTFTPNLKR